MRRLLAIFLSLLVCAHAQIATPDSIQLFPGKIQVLQPAFDADALAYFQKTGITDPVQRAKINTLVTVIKANANWNDARIYLLRSNQNIGTGSTVYTLGGWSTDNHTLVNGPSWTTNGVDFNGTTQYGIDPNDIWAGGTALTILADFNTDAHPASSQYIVDVFSSTSPLNQRSFATRITPLGASYDFIGSSDGITPVSSTFGTSSIGAQRSVIQIYSSSSLVAYVNGSLATVSGSPPASLFNSTAKIMIGAINEGAPVTFFDGTVAAVILFKSTLSAANALAINSAMEGLR